MQTQDIRRLFLKYFKEKGHSIIPSSPVLPHDDPSLLFINAGMNQFKDVFLGKSVRDYKRATTSQKCIRAGGKHNDLENVGHTSRHLTFFEMLGNFSFGDYFKKDAIKFAWEVSTQVFQLDPDRIWPTVFREDDEAFELWREYFPAEKITRLDEDTNFWAMGDTGPCGPCSELLYDRGPRYGNALKPIEDPDGERFLEFWNLVFMQYNRLSSTQMDPLPKPSIDTGAGLERIISLKMDVESVFATDVLRSLIAQVEQISGVPYAAEDTIRSPAFRVIADHLRCLSFAIADGVQPSNVDRGYVLRKVLRRAVRYGKSLGMEEPFLAKVLPRLVETMGEDYPELKASQGRIAEILTSEEEAFIRTLRRGGNILHQVIDQSKQEKRKITGDEAFKLKDTYGFPIEEILLIARDATLEVDYDRFLALEQEAKERSRNVAKVTQQVASESIYAQFMDKHGASEFVGYHYPHTIGKVIGIFVDGRQVDSLQQGETAIVILDKTPFYAEMGGQVGDLGVLENEGQKFLVEDCTSPFKGIIAHIGKMEKGSLHLHDTVNATIDSARRQKIANNHTATHLLHWALQQVLGEHIKQAGSVVDPYRLRFDFSHHKALSREEIKQLEDLVNNRIRENIEVQWYELSYDEVQKREDIKQFFGEKYGAKVRVVDIDFSKELCGGTHTSRLGTIGYFRINKEGSIAAGVRRIEAVTGEEAELFARESDELVIELSALVKTQPQKLKERLEKLLEENKQAAQELKMLRAQQLESLTASLLEKKEILNNIPLIISKLEITPEELRICADNIMNKLSSGILVLAASQEQDKCHIISRVTEDLIQKGYQANEIIKQIAPLIEGSGGGKPNSAQAGGKAPQKISEAFTKVKEFLSKDLN